MIQTCFSAQFLLYADVAVLHTPANPAVVMILRSMRFFLSGCLLLSFALLAPIAKPDSLSIVYTSPQNRSDVVSSGFTSVVFAGFVMNNTDAPITFQLSYVLGSPSSFYVASLIQGIGFPGVTLGAGQSTSVFDLATENMNPFDPSLTYPGVVNFTFDAISLPTGGLITESSDSVEVAAGVPETSTFELLAVALLATFVAARIKLRAKGRREVASATLSTCYESRSAFVGQKNS